jgi:ribosomal protein L11 methyltransferase
MERFIKIEIENLSGEQSDILIDDLSAHNFYAFEQEDANLFAYIKEIDFDSQTLKNLLPPPVYFTKTYIESKNWNEQWEREFQPVVVNNFVAIRPQFHEPIANVKHDIIITPKMSFGTGHHPTTFLMISHMEKMNFQNKTVLDFGAGTGVLAILAEKSGASEILAVDMDEWSIQNANENIKANQCNHIIVIKQDNIDGFNTVDILLANINLNILINSAAAISAKTKTGGYLLTSGFLISDEKRMIKEFKKVNFVKKNILEKDNWSAILFQKDAE